jgi:hypothetical protein
MPLTNERPNGTPKSTEWKASAQYKAAGAFALATIPLWAWFWSDVLPNENVAGKGLFVAILALASCALALVPFDLWHRWQQRRSPAVAVCSLVFIAALAGVILIASRLQQSTPSTASVPPAAIVSPELFSPASSAARP